MGTEIQSWKKKIRLSHQTETYIRGVSEPEVTRRQSGGQNKVMDITIATSAFGKHARL